MLGLKDFITHDEYRNWKKAGLNPNKKDLQTQLLPQNIDYEAAIKTVLKCYKFECCPPSEVSFVYQLVKASNPEIEKVIEMAGNVVIAKVIEEAKRSKEKIEKSDDK